MGSVEKAQQLLKNKGYSPAQIEQITSELTILANILVDQYLDNRVDNINK